MNKRVLNVGQCGLDHGSITRSLQQHFGAQVDAAHDLAETLRRLEAGRYDLVLVNRRLDSDGSDGLEIVREIRRDRRFETLPVMMVSNFPEAQAAALEAGAVPGFGKAALESDETRKRLATFLEATEE